MASAGTDDAEAATLADASSSASSHASPPADMTVDPPGDAGLIGTVPGEVARRPDDAAGAPAGQPASPPRGARGSCGATVLAPVLASLSALTVSSAMPRRREARVCETGSARRPVRSSSEDRSHAARAASELMAAGRWAPGRPRCTLHGGLGFAGNDWHSEPESRTAATGVCARHSCFLCCQL